MSTCKSADDQLHDANVFITGANKGLGLGLVKEFLKVPSIGRVFAGCRRPEDAKDLQQLSMAFPSNLRIIQIDVTSDESIKSSVKEIEAALGEEYCLNLLVNNAGVLLAGGLNMEEPDRDICLEQFNTNTMGTMMTTAAFLALLRKAASQQEFAAVVNISGSLSQIESMRPLDTIPNRNRVYGMSKNAINFYTKALSMDVPEILSVAIHPGWFRTEMGGQQAPFGVEETAANFVRRIRVDLRKEDSGKYIDWSDTVRRNN